MTRSLTFRFLGAGVLLASLAACSTLRDNYAKPPSEALAPAVDTPSTAYIQAEENKHASGQSGFRLLTLSTNALMSRISLVDHAEHSLDLQYYIFHNDQTGKLVAQHLLKAADRGVRVRILLDDIGLDKEVPMFDALDTHPNIEVRLFNPLGTRKPNIISKTAQVLFDFRRLNRRMHNKSLISDNKVAIVGGRNIADEFFDASENNNFRDLDLLAIGPVVQAASRSFDDYWNDKAAVPVTAFAPTRDSHGDLVQVRADLSQHARAFADSDYAQAIIDELPDGATGDRKGQWFWGSAVLIADQPEKIESGKGQHSLRIGPALQRLMDGATSELLLMSPYFVPSDSDEQRFVAIAKRGVTTRIVTNSLASTDEPAVQNGYAKHRHALLAGGIELYELKPVAGVKQTYTHYGQSSGVSLHAKAMVVDRRFVYVGSMNMDQRSKLLNTEMGLIVDSLPLAKAVAEFFATTTLPANAYQLELASSDGSPATAGHLRWKTVEAGKPVILTHEPGVGPVRRMETWLFKLLLT